MSTIQQQRKLVHRGLMSTQDLAPNSSNADIPTITVSFPTSPPRIERASTGPVLVKCDEPCSLVVDVAGSPMPQVTWRVGNRRVRDSTKYRTTVEGRRHTLIVSKVTEELEKGVWIMAANEVGEDSCIIAVKTYKVFSGLRFSFNEGDVRQTACGREEVLRRSATTRSQLRRPVFSDENQSVKSVPYATDAGLHDEWRREMALRNRMRSVDDLQKYQNWKKTDSIQSFETENGAEVTSATMNGHGRRRRMILVRRNRSVSDVSDSSEINGSVSQGIERSSRRRQRNQRQTMARSLSAAAPTTSTVTKHNGVAITAAATNTGGDATSMPSFPQRSSSVGQRRRSSSGGRRRDDVPQTGSLKSVKSKQVSLSSSQIVRRADDDVVRRTDNKKTFSSSSGLTSPTAAAGDNVDACLTRPPTGRASRIDRSSTTRTSRKKSAAAEMIASTIRNDVVDHQKSLTLTTTESKIGPSEKRDRFMGGKGLSEDKDDMWRLFGVHVSTLVRKLLVTGENDELFDDSSTGGDKAHNLNCMTSSEINEDKATADNRRDVGQVRSPGVDNRLRSIDPAVFTVESNSLASVFHADGLGIPMTSSDPADNSASVCDGEDNPPSSAKLEYKYEMSKIDELFSSADAEPVNESQTVIEPKLPAELANGVVETANRDLAIESRSDFCRTDEYSVVFDGIGDQNDSLAATAAGDYGEMLIGNDAVRSADLNLPNNSIITILSQAIDLQKILNTIDQLIGVGDGNQDDVNANHKRFNLSPLKAKYSAIDQHEPTLEPTPNLAGARPEVLPDGRRTLPATTVVKRGGIFVHSDDDENDEALDQDVESFYCDEGLSALTDLGLQMAVGDNTDNDDDDFDSAEYERDNEVLDIGVVRARRLSQERLQLIDLPLD